MVRSGRNKTGSIENSTRVWVWEDGDFVILEDHLVPAHRECGVFLPEKIPSKANLDNCYGDFEGDWYQELICDRCDFFDSSPDHRFCLIHVKVEEAAEKIKEKGEKIMDEISIGYCKGSKFFEVLMGGKQVYVAETQRECQLFVAELYLRASQHAPSPSYTTTASVSTSPSPSGVISLQMGRGLAEKMADDLASLMVTIEFLASTDGNTEAIDRLNQLIDLLRGKRNAV